MSHILIEKNHSLYYRTIEGKADMPCLVYLHEGLGCTAMWRDFPKQLCRATNCPGLIYDRRGYGMSSPLPQPRTNRYLHEYALRELPAFLDRIIPDTPYILIGHSDGGSIALIYGARRPSKLRGIITEAAHVFVDSETITGIQAAEEAWQRGKLKGLAQYHGAKTETVFRSWSDIWLSESFRHWNIEYLLADIEVPLLIIQGKNDQYGSIDQVNSISTKTSSPCRVEIVEECGHTPHLETSGVVLKLMSDFVKQLIQSSSRQRR
ncbi:alpha/beta fold hydrolase [Desulfopila inferna]|uniref:alpha/beta fold hydrolase n=1 Tax=Desulfopila inferna TaxID=468528 RepID=UPI001963E018|nr:alpha/beta hydrolase [Desulfopila inferna]MBM9603790.1 alpha/beta hydrolase [Desulfopila inferna]